MTARFGLCAIGNAIVDVIAPATAAFIESQKSLGMNPGGMTLIDAERAAKLFAMMGPGTESSGGSAGNTMAAFASMGGQGAYIGKVADDRFGEVFIRDIRSIGVHFETPPLTDGPPTAQCLILVTDDAQRTMNTFLGASVLFTPDDIDEDLISNSEITYLEGYLFDAQPAKDAFFSASEIARRADREIALTLSDPFCVERHRSDFRKLIKDHVDILFANEAELTALYQTDDFEAAIEAVRPHCRIAAVTRGAAGSVIVGDCETHMIGAVPPTALIDTTGAGDAYAAGFLFGLTEKKSLPECGRLGALAASEVISHYGPRPATPLRDLIKTRAA